MDVLAELDAIMAQFRRDNPQVLEQTQPEAEMKDESEKVPKETIVKLEVTNQKTEDAVPEKKTEVQQSIPKEEPREEKN